MKRSVLFVLFLTCCWLTEAAGQVVVRRAPLVLHPRRVVMVRPAPVVVAPGRVVVARPPAVVVTPRVVAVAPIRPRRVVVIH